MESQRGRDIRMSIMQPQPENRFSREGERNSLSSIESSQQDSYHHSLSKEDEELPELPTSRGLRDDEISFESIDRVSPMQPAAHIG